ncbi:MAG: hypothetical protein Q9227_009345 [Pyrenula ochraceoflavens]
MRAPIVIPANCFWFFLFAPLGSTFAAQTTTETPSLDSTPPVYSPPVYGNIMPREQSVAVADFDNPPQTGARKRQTTSACPPRRKRCIGMRNVDDNDKWDRSEVSRDAGSGEEEQEEEKEGFAGFDPVFSEGREPEAED